MNELNDNNQVVDDILDDINKRLDSIFDRPNTTIKQDVDMANSVLPQNVEQWNKFIELCYGIRVLESEITQISILDNGTVKKGCVKQTLQLPGSTKIKSITLDGNSFINGLSDEQE